MRIHVCFILWMDVAVYVSDWMIGWLEWYWIYFWKHNYIFAFFYHNSTLGMELVFEIMPCGRQGPFYSAHSIPLLLMSSLSWRREEAGHQQPWHWPSYNGIFWHQHQKGYSRVSNNSVDTLIKTALDFPWWLAYLIPSRLLKFSKFSILYIPTDAILRCLTRYRATRSFVRLFWRILPVLTVRESPSNQ